jgi:hypothetical protein
MCSDHVNGPEYDIRGDCGSANREPVASIGLLVAIQLVLEPLARPSRMVWSKT